MSQDDPQPSRSADARHHPDHPALGAVRAERRAAARHGRRRSSTSARGGGRCCSCAPTSSATSCPAWSTCRATATPRWSGWRCRTSWSANSAALSIDYTARVSESPWAVVHFTVRLPDGADRATIDTSEANRVRIQDLLTEAARTWGDRLIGSVQDRCRSSQAIAEHYADAFPEDYKQVVTPLEAIADIAIIEELQDEFGQAAVRAGRRGDAARPTSPGTSAARSASLSQLLPMLQCMGVRGARGAAVHRDPPRRAAGVDLPVQDPARSVDSGHGRRRGVGRHRAAVRRRGHRDLARPRRDRPVQRTGAARRPDLAAGHGAARLREVPAAGRFSLQPVAHRVGAQRQRRHRAVPGRAVRGDVRSRSPAAEGPRRPGRRRRGRRRHRRAGQPGHRPGAAGVRLDDPGHAAHQLLRHRPGLGARPERAVDQAQSAS